MPSQNGSSVAPSVTVLSSMNSGQNGSIFVTAMPGSGSSFAASTPAHETLMNLSSERK